jgi:hypothetical protein
MKATVSSRARSHEDRGGDPLDGLVNLFDLGIVLAVAFLIAALSSLDLTEVLTDREAAKEKISPDAIVLDPDEEAKTIDLQPGQRVVGTGEQIGRVYRLKDGRLVIVRGKQGNGAGPEQAGE